MNEATEAADDRHPKGDGVMLTAVERPGGARACKAGRRARDSSDSESGSEDEAVFKRRKTGGTVGVVPSGSSGSVSQLQASGSSSGHDGYQRFDPLTWGLTSR